MIANISRAAVEDMSLTESMTMSPRPKPAPVKRPNTVGTMIRASRGVRRLLMMSPMKVAIIRNPSTTSMGVSWGVWVDDGVWAGAKDGVCCITR